MSAPHVSRISFARLYNTGNYEHVRYEIAADIGPGDDAATVAKNILSILAAANPRCPVDEYTIDHLQARVNWTREEQKRYYGDAWERRVEEDKRELAKLITARDDWRRKHSQALDALNNLNAPIGDGCLF